MRKEVGAGGRFDIFLDSEVAKIWFSGYYKCQKSPRKSLFTCRRELECSDGGL